MDIKKSALFAESWNVAIRKAPQGAILYDEKTAFTVIPNSYRYWAADPFLFEKDGEVYIFAELYDYIKRRGVIGYYKLSDRYSNNWRVVIEEKYHMSYPYIYEKDDNIYIMPETSENNEIAIYKAKEFPDKWEKIKILRKNKFYVDTTILKSQKGKYALTYDVEDSRNPLLCLLDLNDNKNDIVFNVKNVDCERPAGKTFSKDNELIRPAQYCVGDYGKGLLFYRYILNDKRILSEQLIKKILPDELCYTKRLYLDGMHTYNALDKYEVIDIKTRRFNLLNFISRIIGKVTKK